LTASTKAAAALADWNSEMAVDFPVVMLI